MDRDNSERKSDSCEPISDSEIDEALAETFPASDPPPWTLGVEPHCQPALDNFQTTFWDKVFRKVESKRKVLNDAIEDAKAADAKEYLESVESYQHEREEWKEKQDIAE